MKSILVELTCANCLYHTYRKSETLLISDFETQAREELLHDTFFSLRCPRCGKQIAFLHPLAYVDKLHAFILLIKPEKDFQEKDQNLYAEDVTSKKRFLCDHRRISEKMRILEDDLDDRVIEILKYRVKLHYMQKKHCAISIQYKDMDSDSQTIWFTITKDEGMEAIALMCKEYDDIKSKLPLEEHDKFLKVDEKWVREYLKTQKRL